MCAQFDYLVREKIADGALISKWRKPGYEILCSMLAIQRNNHNFGTTAMCRWVDSETACIFRTSKCLASLTMHQKDIQAA